MPREEQRKQLLVDNSGFHDSRLLYGVSEVRVQDWLKYGVQTHMRGDDGHPRYGVIPAFAQLQNHKKNRLNRKVFSSCLVTGLQPSCH